MILIRVSVLVTAVLVGLALLDRTEGRSRQKSYSQDLDSYDDSYPVQADYPVASDPNYNYEESSYQSKPKKSYSKSSYGSRKGKKSNRRHKSRSHKSKLAKNGPEGRFILSGLSHLASKVGGLFGMGGGGGGASGGGSSGGYTGLTGMVSNMLGGGNIMGMFSKVKGMFSGLYDKASSTGGAAVDKVKDFFGVLSNSGFDGDNKEVKDKAGELLSGATGFLSSFLSNSGSADSSGSAKGADEPSTDNAEESTSEIPLPELKDPEEAPAASPGSENAEETATEAPE